MRMESAEGIPVSVSISDMDFGDLDEVIKHLPNVSIAEILESHSLYKLALIYAARGSHRKFMRKMALTGVAMKDTDVLRQLKIRKDVSQALQTNDFDGLRKLLESEDVSSLIMKEKAGNDLISSAILCGCSEFLKFLIQRYSIVNKDAKRKYLLNGSDSHGLTPLIAAVLAGNLACVQILLDEGAGVDVPDAHCATEQLEKMEDGGVRAPKEKEKAYKKDILYGSSKTALMYAVCTKNSECVKILLKYKPDMKKKSHVGLTAIGYAAVTSEYNCLNLLLTTPVQMNKHELMGNSNTRTCHKPSGNCVVFGDSFDFTAVPEHHGELPKLGLSMLEKTGLKRKKDHDFVAVALKSEPETESTDESGSDDSKGDQSDDNVDANDTSGTHAGDLSRQIPCNFSFGEKPTPLNPAGEPRKEESTLNSKDKPFSFEFGSGFSLIEPKFTIGDFTPKGVRPAKAKNRPKQNVKKEGSTDFFKELRDIGNSAKNVDVRAIAEASLPFAIMGEDIQCLKLLLHHCGNLGCTDRCGKTPLILAAEQGKVDYVELLLKNWAGVDAPVSLGMNETALMLAAKNGHTDCLNVLLQHNANVAAANWCKETALMYAIKNGRTECLKILLEHKANVHEFNAKGQTPLMIAAESGTTECIELLLKAGCKINESDWCQKSVLTYAVESGNAAIVKLILETLVKEESASNKSSADPTDTKQVNSTKKEDDHQSDSKAKKPAKEACVGPSEKEPRYSNSNQSDDESHSESEPSDVDKYDVTDPGVSKKRFVDQKEKTNEEEKEGAKSDTKAVSIRDLAEKSLPYAARGGSRKCLEMLLPHCKNYNHTEIMAKKTALMLAAEKGQVDCLNLLINHGVDLDFISASEGNIPSANICKQGISAVMCATLAKRKECLKILLEKGADPNTGMEGFSRKTAIIIATCNRDHDCMRLLMKHGADATAEDDNDQSAFMEALDSENFESLRIILSAGLKLDIVDFYEREKFDKVLKCPKGLEFLLKEGMLSMSKEIEAPLVNQSGEPYFHRDCNHLVVDSLKIMMEYGVFDWKASCNHENIKYILLIALSAGISPREFFSYSGGDDDDDDDGPSLVSPMKFALLRYQQEETVRFLLSNLYFTLDDYRCFTSDRNTGKEEPLDTSWLDPGLVTMCFRNPWRLETLCLLTASDCLAKSATSHLPRTKQVSSLPIPEKFKKILRFDGAHSRLCMEHWQHIGKPESQEFDNNILCLTKPSYPPSAILVECETHKCPFKRKGLVMLD